MCFMSGSTSFELNEVEILGRTPDLNLILTKVFLLVTGSLTAFLRIILLKTYITIYKLDVISLSETYLDSGISNDDDKLEIPGYLLVKPITR